MDIQISAAQGRGKSTLARAIANTQGGIIYDLSYDGSPNIVMGDIARKIVEARADVVIVDGCEPRAVELYIAAVWAARQSLRRNIVAIYCVQDPSASVAHSTQAFIPFGFVNAGNVWVDEATEISPEQIEKLKSRNTFKGEQLRAEQLRAAGIAVKSVDLVEDAEPVRNTFKDNLHRYASGGVALDVQQLEPEQAAALIKCWQESHENVLRVHDEIVVDMATRSYSAEQLTAMARVINLQGNPADVAQLESACAHFGVASVDILPPIFHATAHDLILPIVERIKSRNSEPY